LETFLYVGAKRVPEANHSHFAVFFALFFSRSFFLPLSFVFSRPHSLNTWSITFSPPTLLGAEAVLSYVNIELSWILTVLGRKTTSIWCGK
jgi:ABC-type Na+ efflux pump permease subunit